MPGVEREPSQTGETILATYEVSPEGLEELLTVLSADMAKAERIRRDSMTAIYPEKKFASEQATNIGFHVHTSCQVLDAVIPRKDGIWLEEVRQRTERIREQEKAERHSS